MPAEKTPLIARSDTLIARSETLIARSETLIARSETGGCLSRVLGLTSTNKSDLLRAIVLDEHAPPPSYLQCLLGCDCATRPRREGGVRSVPALSHLAGLLFQNGDETHATDGTVFTLKWADYDATARRATVPVYGHRCCQMGRPATGAWSVLENRTWGAISVVARCCDYSYRFRFAEDYGRADIDIRANAGLCCLPAWCTVPARLAHFEMVRDEAAGGARWFRNSSSCGGPMQRSYVLEAAYGPDGAATEFAENFENEAPAAMWLSR